MGLKSDNIVVLVKMNLNQIGSELQSILRKLKVNEIEQINSGMGALDGFSDHADLEIVVSGATGFGQIGSHWAVQIYVYDLHDGRCVVEFVALGEGAFTRGLRFVNSHTNRRLYTEDLRGLKLSNSKSKRAKIVEALGGQILPEDEAEADRIISGATQPNIPLSQSASSPQPIASQGVNNSVQSNSAPVSNPTSRTVATPTITAPIFNDDGSVNITGQADETLINWGDSLEKQRKFGHAAKCFEAVARKGNPEGQYKLGLVEWRSASAIAQSGSAEESKKAFLKALKWIKPAADGGHSESQFRIGEAYMFGRGVEKDMGKAKEYYQKAANQGYEQAQQILSKL
jgi:TPR repeat protein